VCAWPHTQEDEEDVDGVCLICACGSEGICVCVREGE